MTFTSQQLDGIVENMWTTVLDLPIQSLGVIPPVVNNEDGQLTGCVHITGAWRGAMLLECPTALVRRAASIFFEMTAEEVTDAELGDAIGELINIAGGNVKALISGPTQLSLPTVVEGVHYRVVVGSSRETFRLAYDCEGARMTLRVVEVDSVGRRSAS